MIDQGGWGDPWPSSPLLKIAPPASPAAFSADGDQHAGIGGGQHALVLLPVIGIVIALLTMIMMIMLAARKAKTAGIPNLAILAIIEMP